MKLVNNDMNIRSKDRHETFQNKRAIAGNMQLHEDLESTIAQFKGVEAALTYSAGYTANVGLIPTLVENKQDLIISDEDVWKVVDLLIQETKELNEKQGKQFDIESSVQAQLPFFSCKNRVFSKEIQKDIQKKTEIELGVAVRMACLKLYCK